MILAESVGGLSQIAGQSTVAAILIVVGGGLGKMLLREKDRQIEDRDRIIAEKDERLEQKNEEIISLRRSAQEGVSSLGKIGDVMNQALGLLMAQNDDVRVLLEDLPARPRTPRKRTTP